MVLMIWLKVLWYFLYIRNIHDRGIQQQLNQKNGDSLSSSRLVYSRDTILAKSTFHDQRYSFYRLFVSVIYLIGNFDRLRLEDKNTTGVYLCAQYTLLIVLKFFEFEGRLGLKFQF